jgi:stress-induced-phosphoprotein 1
VNPEAIKFKDLGNKAFQGERRLWSHASRTCRRLVGRAPEFSLFHFASDSSPTQQPLLARAHTAKQFEDAIVHFSKAIELDASDAVFFSNRSGAYAGLNRWTEALADGERAVALKPTWGKAYSRKGLALMNLKRLEEAEAAFVAGLKLEPGNESMLSGLEQVQDIKLRGMALSSLWHTMDWWAALQAAPEFEAPSKSSEFRDKLDVIAKDPLKVSQFAGDADVVRAVGYLVSVWSRAYVRQQAELEAQKRDEEAARARKEREAKEEAERKAKEEAEREASLSPEAKAAKEAKERGAEHYKKKEFAAAIAAFTEAISATPDDISLLTNRAAAHIEAGDFAAAAADGELAVEKGRAVRADYALIARAFERIGTARQKAGELEAAIKAFKAALAENRNVTTLAKLQAAERELEESKRKAYEDPEKAAAEKAEGNRLFKEARYPEAIKHYEEAIKRAPRDPLLYTNLASALGKLLEFPSAISNCKKALDIDPKCFKAHLKKGHFEFFAKDYKNALESYTRALEIEPENAEALQSLERLSRAIDERNRSSEAPSEETIANDPELQEILTNPVMRKVLQDMQTDPKAAQEHMKNATVRKNIEKLIAAGVLKTK